MFFSFGQIFGRFFLFMYVPDGFYLACDGHIVDDADKHQDGEADEQGGEEGGGLEACIELAEERQVPRPDEDDGDDGADEHHDVEHDGEQVEGPRHAAGRVAYEQQVVNLLRVFLQQQEDAEQEDVEGENGDDESHGEHHGGDHLHERGGARGIGVGGLGVIALLL